ncbi:MAG: MBOAT family protein [Verrucomicrobia subdivision 3 bacterium]|nr:MBOAT family protein [Verrucomicrobiota bacterium]MCC6819700.1 MBOAT family protein [Limisphaerales bacterium]
MLFHTWPFLVFMLVVLPGFYALRKTRLWLPWLTAASYFFYGWWNPYYLLLVVYSTLLDFCLVALMDHCPRSGQPTDVFARLTRLRFDDGVLKVAFIVSAAATVGCLAMALFGLATLRPTMLVLGLILLLMALGALYSSRRIWLLISIVNNLALLLFFKYARFAVENLNAVFSSLHVAAKLSDPSTLMPFGFDYLLPVGISFFTFQSLSYTIDFYLGNVQRERNFVRFATFVCFFPQLMAGPIERAKHLLPQFHQFPPVRLRNFTDGASLFLVGLFKKLALANYLSFYVERVYDNPKVFAAPALILATFAFAWQIFFDFSGYTDMARGVAKLMGFDLILNFNNPYLATGLGDFWARWHIGLSSWFRDYVYIPLGGNRGGLLQTYRNLFITFFISGIWHGASWTFMIWGTLHAAGIITTRELERSGFYRERVPRLLKQVGVFMFVCFAWIFFRANSLADALLIVNRIFTSAWQDPQMPALMLILVAAIWLYQFTYESRFRAVLQTAPIRVGVAVLMVLYLSLCASGGGAFIYFQF